MTAYINLVIAILGSSVITAIVTWLLTRRKIEAETQSEELNARSKVSDLLEKMQSENVDLYKRNTELEKSNTDKDHSIEVLTARLDARDSQLAAATKQLDLLRDLAKDAPITETLRSQLEAVNQFAANSQTMFQTMQSDLSKLLMEKEAAMQELLRTNNDLRLKRPSNLKKDEGQ
jgi:hypothetical protein